MLGLSGPTAAQWDDLAWQAGNIFSTRLWNDCWWEHFGRNAAPLVLTDDEASPSVILPLYQSGRSLKVLRIIGSGVADELGPICAPAHRRSAEVLLRENVVKSDIDWDALVLNDVASHQEWNALKAREIRRHVSPVIHFEGQTWGAYLQQRSRNFRSELGRRGRRIHRDFSVRFRLACAESLSRDLEALFRLHRERWGANAPFATGVQRRFHENFAAEALARGWLRLWILDLDGLTVAAIYGFRYAGAEYMYQSGRDASYDRYSVGTLLLAHAVEAAHHDGMEEYRLLRGGEQYKFRFSTISRTVHTLAIAHGIRGRVAIEAAQLRFKLWPT